MPSVTPEKLLVSFNSQLGLKHFRWCLNVFLPLWSSSRSLFQVIFVAALLLWFSAAASPFSLPHTRNRAWIMQAVRDLHLADKDADFFATIVCNTCISKYSFVVRKKIKIKKARQPEQPCLVAARGKVRHKTLALICFSCFRDERLSCGSMGGPFAPPCSPC